MGLLDTIKIFIRPTGDDTAARSRDFIRYAAVGVTVCYAAALTYRAGGVRYLLPATAYEKLVTTVEKVKEGTKPLVNAERFGLCSKHLMTTYAVFSGGCILSALGTRAFFAYPDLPIGVPIAATATAATVLMFARQWMTFHGKLLAFGALAFSCGVSFGPLNWVAYDTVIPFSIVVGSTAVGFCAPLFITRGVVSYFCSAQLLSCSLSVVGAGLVVASAKINASGRRARHIENDVSVMLVGQVVINVALGVFHTIPTIYRFMKNDLAEIQQEDPVFQATLIYSACAYSLWTFFRIICARIMRTLQGKHPNGHGKDSRTINDAIGTFSSADKGLFTVRNVSNVGASLLFLFTYVRAVTYIQSRKGGSSHGLDFSRKVFSKFSPVAL